MVSTLRRVMPLAVTLVALAAAFNRFDIGPILKSAADLPVTTLLLVALALLAGNLLACLRLKLIAQDFHQRLSLRDAIVATLSGQLAGSFFFQIIGQTIARSAVLSKTGVSVSTTMVITGYERLVAAGVSFALALAGTFYLFGRVTLDLAGGGDELLKILAGILAVTISGAVFAWGRQSKAGLRAALSAGSAWKCARASLVSLAIQATTMGAYVVAAHNLAVSVSIIDLMAATALVMLAASVPISFAGWGLREVSAVYALGAIGIPYEASLVVAVLIGFASIALTAVLAVASSLAKSKTSPAAFVPRQEAANVDYTAFLSWFFPLFAASAVFFQLHVPVGTGELNVNLADSVVLFGGALLVLRMVGKESLPGASRLPRLGLWVGLMSVVITLSFIHGWAEYGWTNWGFTNRLFGWLVLLSYAATAALIILQEGDNGLRVLLRTFVTAGLTVCVLDLALILAAFYGVPVPEKLVAFRMEGFSQNPNALAFQLLLVMAAIIGLSHADRAGRWPLVLAFIALFFTGSRAGEGTCVIMFAAAIYFRFTSARAVLISLVYAAIGVTVITGDLVNLLLGVGRLLHAAWQQPDAGLLSSLMHPGTLPPMFFPHANIEKTYSMTSWNTASDAERWTSIILGFKMFLAHPIFGAGLGAFIEEFIRENGHPLIIHSTPVWLLAEMGLVGFAVFAAPFVYLFYREVRFRRAVETAGPVLVIGLLAFGVMSQVHELLYQRTLWLLIGAAIAIPNMKQWREVLPGAQAAETASGRATLELLGTGASEAGR